MLRIYKSHLSRSQYSYKKPFVLTINVVYRRSPNTPVFDQKRKCVSNTLKAVIFHF